jgi:peptidase M23-like protein
MRGQRAAGGTQRATWAASRQQMSADVLARVTRSPTTARFSTELQQDPYPRSLCEIVPLQLLTNGRSTTEVLFMVRGVRAVLRGTVCLVTCAVVGAGLAPAGGAAWSPRARADEEQGPPSVPGSARSDGRVWPVEGRDGAPRPQVSRGWKPPPEPWAAGHRGVDLAAPRGSPVRAVADGRISFAGSVAGRGVVSIELSATGRPPLRTTYEPVRPSMHKGERVRAGQTVGTVASGPFHCQRGCLHWGARRGERYLDPLSLLPAALLRGSASRLLPVFGVPLPEAAANERHGVVSSAAAAGPTGTPALCLTPAAGFGRTAFRAHRRLAQGSRCTRAGRCTQQRMET